MIVLVSKLAYLAMVCGWLAIRLPHVLRARRTPVSVSHRDLRERILMAISGAGMGYIPLAYCIVGFNGVGDRPASVGLLALGLAFGAVGIALYHASHRDLGRQWSVSLEIRANHVLRTDGLYRHVRHPMYAAYWIGCVAQVLILPNVIAGASGLIGFGCLYAYRVRREERMMRDRFGAAYADYARVTPRVFPRGWGEPKAGRRSLS